MVVAWVRCTHPLPAVGVCATQDGTASGQRQVLFVLRLPQSIGTMIHRLPQLSDAPCIRALYNVKTQPLESDLELDGNPAWEVESPWLWLGPS